MAAVVAPAAVEPPPAAQGVIDEVLREMPGSFLCPLSKEVMTDPVLLVVSGHTYERAALAKHFMKQGLSSESPPPSATETSKVTKELLEKLLKQLRTSST
jgi:predicted HD phosphohydrolase